MVKRGRYLLKSKREHAKEKPNIEQIKAILDHSLYGVPVEEVDPFVFDETFCVICKKYGTHYVYRFSASRSLFIFGPFNPIRKFACRIISNQFFDFLIILVILCNCVTLAMLTNYEDTKTGKIKVNQKLNEVIEYVEYLFLFMYSLEMALKIVARGFAFNKFSYIRNSWNILDFAVVTASAISIILMNLPSGSPTIDLELFRSLRVLRVIKTISIVPGLRLMINALVSSVVQLLEVMALTLFCLMLFSLLALELFMGKLRQKCVLVKNGVRHLQMIYEERSRSEDELGSIDPNDPDRNLFFYEWANNRENWLIRKDDYPKEEYQPCGNDTWSRRCPPGYECLDNIGDNYDDGWTSFDNFFNSMLTTFQLITLDFWERIYDLVLSPTSPWSVIFFLLVIFLGSFYLLNLMLAVVAMSYDREYHKSAQVALPTAQKLSLKRKASTFSFQDPASLNIIAMTHMPRRTPSEREMIIRTIKKSSSSNGSFIQEYVLGGESRKQKHKLHHTILTLLGRRRSGETENDEDTGTAPESRSGSIFSKGPKPSAVSTSIDASRKESKKFTEDIVEVPTNDITAKKLTSTTELEPVPSDISAIEKKEEKSGGSGCWFLLCLENMFTSIANHEAFEMAITTIIILNTFFLACEHHNQPEWLNSVLKLGNHFFTVAFSIEAVIKICALQRNYFRSIWNIFDLFLVAMSFLDLALEEYNLTVIRTMRLLRVFKLAQNWITMKVLLNIIVSSFVALGYLTLILLIVLYIFAVLGMQIIGKFYTRKLFDAQEDDDFPRWNFQDFLYAFMMVFRVICGEWVEPLWDCLLVTGHTEEEYKCFCIFLPVLVVGNFIVLNLFLALLLQSFDSEELNAKKQQQQQLANSGKLDILKRNVGMLLKKRAESERGGKKSSSSSETETPVFSNPATKRTSDSHKSLRGLARFRGAANHVIKLRRKALAENVIKKYTLKAKLKMTSQSHQLITTSKVNSKRESVVTVDSRVASPGETKKSLKPSLCLPKKFWTTNCMLFNHFRRMKWVTWDRSRFFSMRVVNHPVFEWLILALIFASSITLCFEDTYLDDKQELKEALFYINATFAVIFILEMIFKWFALGLWSYFTNSWTILDFFIIAVSLLSLFYEAESRMTGHSKSSKNSFAALKALRTLRALRPLRAISRWEGMKIIVNALLIAIPSIFNVFLVCLVFWLIFAIMGVHTFKGKFFKCVDDYSGDMVSSSEVRTKEDCCKKDGYSWVNQTPNFDNVFQAYFTLFQVATFEGWMEAMQASVDSTQIDEQPIRENATHFYFFYVFFVVFGSFFTLNLFIGVIIDNFNRLKKKYEGNLLEALLTPSQRYYYSTLKKLERKKPRRVIRRPTNSFAALCYDVSMSRKFEIALFILIFFNMVIMAFDHHNQREIVSNILSGFNSFLTAVYSLEAIMKIVGLRQYYFTVPWNIFDFLLVVASIFDLAVGNVVGNAFPIPPIMLRVVRVFRIGRVLRLFKAAKGIRRLVFALIVSLPALFNIGALLGLITFIYAILGMALFGRIAKNTAIDEIFNFETFLRSCLLLLRIMTAAGWNDVLHAMFQTEPVCGTYRRIPCGRPGEGECANALLAILYMVSYLFISYLVVINMYIAIILENFYQASRDEDVGIVEDDLEMFYQRWSRYDPQATQFINFDALSDFLDSLDPPVGFHKPNLVAIVAFNLPIARGNKIHCLDILYAIVKNSIGHVDDSENFTKLQNQMDHKFRKTFPTRRLLDIISTTRQWKMQHNAAITIQRAWRAYRKEKYPEESKWLEMHRRGTTTSLQDHHGFLNKMGHLFGGHRDGRLRSSFNRSPKKSAKSTVSSAFISSKKDSHGPKSNSPSPPSK